jgi:hypothetical protein
MIERLDDSLGNMVGLSASGTVMARDVKAALRVVGVAERLLVVVTSDFDGYLSELVGGLQNACSHGEAGRCALVVPQGMTREARLRGESGSFRVFETRAAAEQWLSA